MLDKTADLVVLCQRASRACTFDQKDKPVNSYPCCTAKFAASLFYLLAMFEESFEAQIELQAQLDTLQREKEALLSSRAVNLPQNIAAYRKQNEKLKAQLKSDLKKSNTFVKKLKTITAEGIQQCIRDTETVNLTLFVSEIVNAVVATTYKATDVTGMVKLCVSMHQRYEEFCEPLLTGLKQALLTPPVEDDPEAGKRKRIQIRFMVELYQAGLLSEDEYFVRLLKNLLGKGKRLVDSCLLY
jgi:ElaB/YqjD/DUF883 family membrane-anchored ribosome-binding protein